MGFFFYFHSFLHSFNGTLVYFYFALFRYSGCIFIVIMVFFRLSFGTIASILSNFWFVHILNALQSVFSFRLFILFIYFFAVYVVFYVFLLNRITWAKMQKFRKEKRVDDEKSSIDSMKTHFVAWIWWQQQHQQNVNIAWRKKIAAIWATIEFTANVNGSIKKTYLRFNESFKSQSNDAI